MENPRVLLVVHPDGYVELYGEEGVVCHLVEYPRVPWGLEAEYDDLVRRSVPESHIDLWQDPRLLTNATPNQKSPAARESRAAAAALAEMVCDKFRESTDDRAV